MTTVVNPENSLDAVMSSYRAEAYLKRLGAHEKVADLYDEDEFLRSALNTLVPHFEYPDWSYRTIGETLKALFPHQY